MEEDSHGGLELFKLLNECFGISQYITTEYILNMIEKHFIHCDKVIVDRNYHKLKYHFRY